MKNKRLKIVKVVFRMSHIIKKSLATLCLSATFLVTSFASNTLLVNAEENVKTYGDFIYGEERNYVYINGYNGQEENVKIPETINQKKVISVDISSFKNSKLKSITLSKNINSFIGSASQLGNLQAVHVVSDNSAYCEEDGILYNKNGTELVFYPPNRAGNTFKIPDKVVSVLEMGHNKNIQTLTFSKNMSSGPHSMEESNVKKIIVPKKAKLKWLDDRTFFNCKKLTSINLPNGFEVIAKQAFEGCVSLSNIKLPKTLQEIGDSAFEKCTSLKSVTIPKRVYLIGTDAFASTKTKIIKKNYLKKVKKSGSGYRYVKLACVKQGKKTKSYTLDSIYKMKPSKKKVSFKKNKTCKLEMKLLAGSKWGILKNDVVEYSSSNSKIASVSGKGVVKGKKKGMCTIRIKLYKNEKILSCKVKVRVF